MAGRFRLRAFVSPRLEARLLTFAAGSMVLLAWWAVGRLLAWMR